MPEGRSYTATRTSSVVEGAPFPKAKRRVLGQKKRRPVIVVRDADEPGELRELPGPADVRKADDRPDAEVRFFDYAGGTTVTRSLTNAADMSGADSERNAVLMSFNWSCDASSDGGANWKRLDPTTVFPNTLAGGFCCDQIVIYVPRGDLFVWLLQYSADAAGQGAFRVAVSTSKSVQDDPTVWTYWDFVAGDFGWSTSDMDYPDLAYSDSFLYVSTDVIGSGRVVMRIALEELRAGGTVNYSYTNPDDGKQCWGAHLVQQTGDAGMWAGHDDNSHLLFFTWPDGSGSYFVEHHPRRRLAQRDDVVPGTGRQRLAYQAARLPGQRGDRRRAAGGRDGRAGVDRVQRSGQRSGQGLQAVARPVRRGESGHPDHHAGDPDLERRLRVRLSVAGAGRGLRRHHSRMGWPG